MDNFISIISGLAQALSIIDIIALLVVLISAFAGSHRGLSGELALLISLIGSIVLGANLHGLLAGWCKAHTRLTGEAAQAMGVVVTILVCVVVALIVNFLLRSILRVTIESRFDKFFGAIASMLSTSAIIIIIFIAVNMVGTDYLKKKFGRESLIGSYVVELTPSFNKGMGPEMEEGQLWKPRRLRQWQTD